MHGVVVPAHYAKNMAEKCWDKHGFDGLVVPVDPEGTRGFRPLVRLEREGYHLHFPPQMIRPQRTMYQDQVHLERECISTYVTRVIIIGPDVDGNDGNIGDYAQTMPFSNHTYSPDVVEVRIARDWEYRNAYFPLYSLCRSLNKVVPAIPKKAVHTVPETPF